MTEKANTKSRIPEFANYAEEAEFWDSHDIGDYWDETKSVEVKFSRNLSENLTVRLSPEAISILRRQADQMGIGPSTLARIWIVKQLRESMKHTSQQASQGNRES